MQTLLLHAVNDFTLYANGWRLEFSNSTPAQIDVFGPDQVQKFRISGDITPHCLQREVKRFLKKHKESN